MQILVTGASGRIGRYVVKELVGAGHRVTGVDILAPEATSSRFLRVDLTNAGEVYQALAASGAEAVVHLGAWANAGVVPAATACRLAIEADSVASGVYNITGARVVLSEPTATLVERYFGDKTEVRAVLPDHISPMSCAKAETAFGYQPRFVWSVLQRHLESD